MRTKTVKRVLSLFLVLALTALGGIFAYAADTTATGTGAVTGNVAVNGSINALTISVQHPLSVEYAINPNSGTSGSFTAPDISVKNLTKCPVNVTVSSLQAISGGTITFTDVDPAEKTWATLNAVDSSKYIALGIKAKDSSGWAVGYNPTTHYAAKETATLIGALSSDATGTLTLAANFGLAYNSAYTAKHNLTLLFQLV